MNARIYLDARVATGEAPLKIAIAHEKKTAYIPTGIKVSPDQWNSDAQKVKNHVNRKEMNTILLAKLNAVERQMLILQELGQAKGKSAKEIRDMVILAINPELKAKKDREKTFLYRMERFASLKDKKQTRATYEWTISKLSEFDSSLSKRSFDDITTDYLNEFISHCQGLSVNSKSILLRNIRAVFNDAIDAGITERYPFRRFSIRNERTRKKALTEVQLKTLMQGENEYRDIFLLMFYLRGINAIDLFSAKSSQVINGRLEYRRSKVGTLFSVKIEPEAWEIINRYRGKEYLLNILERNPDYRVYLTNMNRGLKRLGRRMAKDKVVQGAFPELSSNWARHTWATIGINIGIPKDVVSRGMGHSQRGVTEVYIDFDMKAVDEANRKIIDRLR